MNYKIVEDVEPADVFEARLEAVLDYIKDFLLMKNRAYGNSALEPMRVFSKASPKEQILVRIDDKLSRIRNGDTTEDVVLDLIGYLILLEMVDEH